MTVICSVLTNFQMCSENNLCSDCTPSNISEIVGNRQCENKTNKKTADKIMLNCPLKAIVFNVQVSQNDPEWKSQNVEPWGDHILLSMSPVLRFLTLATMTFLSTYLDLLSLSLLLPLVLPLAGGAVAQSVKRATFTEEVLDSIPAVAARSRLVGSVSV